MSLHRSSTLSLGMQLEEMVGDINSRLALISILGAKKDPGDVASPNFNRERPLCLEVILVAYSFISRHLGSRVFSAPFSGRALGTDACKAYYYCRHGLTVVRPKKMT